MITELLPGKILPFVICMLNARTRGLGHLSLTKGDHYWAEVQGNNNMLMKHVVKLVETLRGQVQVRKTKNYLWQVQMS
jgi:hypothetical protein